MAWLNPKGQRELATRTALTKWWPHMTAGIRKRLAVGHMGTFSHSVLMQSFSLSRI
jgi:bromodomain adjacent to zinc finger domain protein 1A